MMKAMTGTMARIAGGGAMLLVVAGAGLAVADEFERMAPVRDAVVAKECSACHMLYPAGLLPASAWRSMMGSLKDHFGENAELDAATTEAIRQYLTANAARESRGAAATSSLRISEQPWFLRKHGKKGRISPASLKRHGAKSPSDCKACHTAAEKGYFEDD